MTSPERGDAVPSETTPVTPGGRARAEDPEAARPERVCPNCGRALLERKCKLLCPSPECGYYMSCSDFY